MTTDEQQAKDNNFATPPSADMVIISNLNIDFAQFHRASRPQLIEAYRMVLGLHLQEGFAGSYGITGRTLELLEDEAPDVIDLMRAGLDRGLLEFMSYTQYHVHPFFSTQEEFANDVRVGIETIAEVLGSPPAGFHPPEFFHLSTRALKELGIEYTVLYSNVVDTATDTELPPVVLTKGAEGDTLPAILLPRESFRTAGLMFANAQDMFWQQLHSVPLMGGTYAYLQYDAEIVLMQEFRDAEQYVYSSSPEEISMEQAQRLLGNFKSVARDLRQHGYRFVRAADVIRDFEGQELTAYEIRTDLGTSTPLSWSDTTEKQLAIGFFHLANVMGRRFREAVEQDLKLIDSQLLYLKGSDHLGFNPPLERIERTSKFARNLCSSLAFRLATYDSPETLYQECAIELDGYYRERLNQAPPPEFAKFLGLLFEAVSDPVAQAGARAVSAEQRLASEADEANDGGDDR
jgi:hypothetical protein